MVALGCRLDKVARRMSVTWLKPASMKEWWRQKWQPWMIPGKGKGKHARPTPWVTDDVDTDTVQVP